MHMGCMVGVSPTGGLAPSLNGASRVPPHVWGAWSESTLVDFNYLFLGWGQFWGLHFRHLFP